MRTKTKSKSRKAKKAGKTTRGGGAKVDLDRELAALPPEAAMTSPAVPVAVLLQEASDVVAGATKHLAKLKKLPFDHALVSKLPGFIDALRGAESAWRLAKTGRSKDEIRAARQEAEELRRDLLAAGRYFLRGSDTSQKLLDAISEGDGLPDLVEDLHALARLSREHARELSGADLPGDPRETAERAEALARQLSAAVSEENADDSARQAMARRNQVATLVTGALGEIRAAARYALRKDPKALAPFRANYVSRKPPQRPARPGISAASAPGLPAQD